MAFGTPPYVAHIGGQDEKSLMGVVGTLGTADTGGTAQILPVGVDPTTGALFVNNIGTSGGSSGGNPTSGTLNTLGTVGTILGVGGTNVSNIVQWNGTTVSPAGTFSDGYTPGTTIATGAVLFGFNGGGGGNAYDRVYLYAPNDAQNNDRALLVQADLKIWNGATWDRMRGANMATNTVGTALLAAGIQGQDSGGTYHNIAVSTGGSIGTIILPNIPGGTINNVGSVVGAGTLTNVGSVTNIGQVYNAGTVQNILGGTVQTNPIPAFTQATFGSHGTTGATVFGTLAGGTSSGAGTEIFITSLSLTIPSTAGSQDVSIGFGTNGGTFHAGTGLLVRGNFPAGGGIQKTFMPAINSGTNAQVTYFQAGAGTVDVNITYFVTASTL